MGFSTLVRICNLRYLFALRRFAEVARPVAADSIPGKAAGRRGIIGHVQVEQWVLVARERVSVFAPCSCHLTGSTTTAVP
jgi:hypothetical protein